MIDYEKDLPDITKSDLVNITNLTRQVIMQEQEVVRIEERLKKAKESLRKVQEVELPEAMKACGMDKFTTTDGHSVNVTETLYASVPKKNKAQAAKWLLNNGLGSLVKEDVVVSFDNGQHERVREAVAVLESRGFSNYALSESINTASVKSAIKELLADGKDVPLDLFGAHFARKAVVK